LRIRNVNFVDGISRFCFGASYAAALLLELARLIWPRPALRVASLGFGIAGLIAHTIYLIAQRPSLASQGGSILFLTWILAVFYLYGSVHHRQLAWGIFVLPVVVGLVVLTTLFPAGTEPSWLSLLDAVRGERFWGMVHGGLLVLAAVGGCIGFVASVMYLVQARRLLLKAPPAAGAKLPSLERIELMNRRAINIAFPLLTAGALVGVALLVQRPDSFAGWTDPKVIGTVLLWVVFAVLLYLRYGVHMRGRQLAVWTIIAFVLQVITLASSHSAVQGGMP